MPKNGSDQGCPKCGRQVKKVYISSTSITWLGYYFCKNCQKFIKSGEERPVIDQFKHMRGADSQPIKLAGDNYQDRELMG